MIYVVTSGAYSEYEIEAVYDDKELAKELVKLNNESCEYEDARIEEYELNVPNKKNGLPYFARITLECEIIKLRCEPFDEISKTFSRSVGGTYYITVLAKDEDYARKIIVDRFRIFKVENKL